VFVCVNLWLKSRRIDPPSSGGGVCGESNLSNLGTAVDCEGVNDPMRHLRRSLVALVAFAISVALTPIRFDAEGWGCGRVIDGGGGFSSTRFSSSYSVPLSFAHFNYSSKEKANEVFDEHVRGAVRVIETTTKLNQHGAVIGRRAVIICFNPELNQHFAAVFWTDGSTVHSIDSPSLLHVLEFEKGILGEWRPRFSRIRYLLAPDYL